MSNFNVANIVALAVVLIVAFPIHELAHAVTADRLGDPTPRRMGRITLNPLAHLDPFGTLMLFVARVGWAKPVMVQPLNLQGNPRTSMAIVAAAGPLSNLALAILAAIPLRTDLFGISTSELGLMASLDFLFRAFIEINLVLMFFNLIPVPPLDGYKILTGILPPDMAYGLRALEQYGLIILLVAFLFLPALGLNVLGPIVFGPSTQLAQLLIG